MKLKPGTSAVHFNATDLHGNPISPEQFKGHKTMLSFYRYAACPFCNLRVHNIIQRQPDWEKKGLNVVGVFHSPKDSVMKNVGQQKPDFTIIPDPQKELYKLYGVEKSILGLMVGMKRMGEFIESARKGFFKIAPEGGMQSMPADFLIDESGEIVKAYYGKDLGDHLPFDEIDYWLENKNISTPVT